MAKNPPGDMFYRPRYQEVCCLFHHLISCSSSYLFLHGVQHINSALFIFSVGSRDYNLLGMIPKHHGIEVLAQIVRIACIALIKIGYYRVHVVFSTMICR